MKQIEFDFETTFPPLGHPEHHFNKYPDHPWLKTKEEIKKWIFSNIEVSNVHNLILLLYMEDKYKINEDLTVEFSIDKKFFLNNDESEFIPIQIRSVDYFSLKGARNIKSAIGTPYISKKMILSNTKIESFIGISENSNYIELKNCKINSFEGMVDFKKEKSILIMGGNPIKSWDGFKRVNTLSFWQNKWCEMNSYELLMNAPIERINKLFFPDLISNNILKQDKYGEIDIIFLKNKQNERKEMKKNMEQINEVVKSESDKKRKI